MKGVSTMPSNMRKTILSSCCPATLVLLLSFLLFGIEECLGFISPPKAITNLVGLHHNQQQRRSYYETQRYIFGLDKVVENNFGSTTAQEESIAYVIERIGDKNRGNERIFREVAEVCINVFFKEQLDAKPEDRIP